MPFDGVYQNQDVEALWKSFADYICQPYQDPEQQKYLRAWCADLYARRNEGEGIRIDRRRLTADTGRAFEGFCLNDQMCFAHNAGVLALAHSEDSEQIQYADRLVGVWLHDMTPLKDKWKNKLEKWLAEGPDGAWQNFWYKGPVARTIERALAAKDLPEKETNSHGNWLDPWTLRVAREAPDAYSFHRDLDPDILRITKWCRIIIHVLHGAGTVFCIGKNEDIKIMSPVGTTTSHYAEYSPPPDCYNSKRGVLHAALGHPDGRAILIRKTKIVGRTPKPNPWHMEILPAPVLTPQPEPAPC